MPSALPFFSVIIPTYNRAAKVVRAVESVLAQTFESYDIWVIDDGSTDATAAALQPYLERIDHLHYLVQPNSGVAVARNRAIQESRGKWIALLDSDDAWRPSKLADFAREIQAHPEAGLFYSSIEVIDEAGRFLRVNHSRAVRGSAYHAMLKGNFLAISSAVVRRDCFDAAGLFDTHLKFSQDWDLWIRITRRFPIQFVPGNSTLFETATSGKKTSDKQGWMQAHDQILEKAFRDDPSLTPTLRQEIQANIAVVKGRILLEAGDERQALPWFTQAITLQPLLFKAHLFRLLCRHPALRASLPAALLRRLHLPAGKGPAS